MPRDRCVFIYGMAEEKEIGRAPRELRGARFRVAAHAAHHRASVCCKCASAFFCT